MSLALPALVLALAIPLAAVLPLLVTTLAARGLGVGVPLIALGVGRPRVERRWGETRLRLTPWLVTASSTLKDDTNLDVHGEHPGRSFGEVHPLLRAAMIVSGPLVLLLLCTAIGGPAALTGFLHAFDQIVAGALSPLGHAQDSLSRFWHAAGAAPLVTGAALVAKFSAFALLPVPMLAGGDALLQLARWKQAGIPEWARPTIYVGLVLVLGMVGAWAVALVAFLGGLAA